jgi:membrane-anchored protein YejM (alkaline phosphatase superfamily)
MIPKFLTEAREQGELIKSLFNGLYGGVNRVSRGTPIPRIGDYGANVITKYLFEQAKDDEPFFMFTNLMEAHGPFEPTLAYDSKTSVPYNWTSRKYDGWTIMNSKDPSHFADYLDNFRNLYQESVEYLDNIVCEFIDEIQSATENETTFIITSDHGELLGYPEEEYLIGHETGLREALLHVPLLVVNPPVTYEHDGMISHLDMPKLITRLSEGKSPNIDREMIQAERIGIVSKPDNNVEKWNQMTRAVYVRDQKFVWDSDLNSHVCILDEPSRVMECSEANVPSKYKELFNISIDDYSKSIDMVEDDRLDESTKKQLADLGYR